MAKATKYFAAHDGITFTRNSPRTYTHVVLIRESIAGQKAIKEQNARERFARDLAFYTEQAAGQSQRGRMPTIDEITYAKAWLATGADGMAAHSIAYFEQDIAGRISSCGQYYYWVAGWCGRPDLAAKLAAKNAGAIILEAQKK